MRGRIGAAIGFVAVSAVIAAAIAVLGVPESEPEPVTGAWTRSRASATLYLRALGVETPAGACRAPQVRLDVQETAAAVRVAARAVRFIHGGEACTLEYYGPTSHLVRLQRPLGYREVVDARTGTRIELLDASTSVTVPGLPAELHTTDLTVSRQGGQRWLTRQWTGSWHGVPEIVTLTVADQLLDPLAVFERTVTVSGVRVSVTARQDRPRDVSTLQWHGPTGRDVGLDVHLAHGRLDPADVLRWVPRVNATIVRS